MKIVMVHGIGQGGENAAELQDAWQSAIEKGFSDAGLNLPSGIDFLFPHYGDILDAYVQDGEHNVAAEKGAGVSAEFETFEREMALAFRKRLGIEDSSIAEELSGKTELVGEKGPGSWNWVQALLRVADRHLKHTTKFSMKTFVRESYSYLYNQNAQDEVHELVLPMLAGERPTVVIGHSLGSAVTYRCLHSTNIQPDLCMTLGSPLGTQYFVRNLVPLEHPVPDGRWWNGYDERDVVALNPLKAPHFDLSPDIENDNSLKNTSDNHHSSTLYLSSAQVASVLATVLK